MTRPEDAVDIAAALAPNGVDTGHPDNSKAVANGSNGVQHEAKNWIPIAEHVLWEPQRTVKVISIGCGFSGKEILIALVTCSEILT